MKKIILKIILSIFLFLWLSSLVNANLNPFTDIDGFSYDWNIITVSNWTASRDYEVWWLISFFVNNWNYWKITVHFLRDDTSMQSVQFSWAELQYKSIRTWWLTEWNIYYSWNYWFIKSYNTTTYLYLKDKLQSSNTNPYTDFIEPWGFVVNWVLYWWAPEVNQTCEAIFTTDESKFDYNYKEEYTTFIDYIDEDREESLFQYWTDDNKFFISLENVEDLYWFRGSLINNWESSFVFNDLDSPVSDDPTLELNSDLYVNYFRLDSLNWSSEQKVYWINDNWDIIKILNFTDEDETKNFEFNKLYHFPYNTDLKWFKFIFWNPLISADDVDLKVDFWKIIYTKDVHEVCYDEETNENITVDWESYSWSLDNI